MDKRVLWDIDKLSPGNNQRRFFPGIVELSKLIEESGHVTELDVTEEGSIVAGERRYRACMLLNANAKSAGLKLPWPKLPVCIVKGDEAKLFKRNVSENSGRVDFRFIEWAHIFKTYRDTYGLTNAEIGSRTGFHPDTVSRYIAILEKSHPKIIARLEDGADFPVEVLIKIHNLQGPDGNKDVQLLRLEQWLGTAALTGEQVKQAKQRSSALSRRKVLALLKLIQEANYSPETVMVVQFIAGQRNTLPNQLHLKLSRKRRPPPKD